MSIRCKMAAGHVFCAPRNLCVFLFTYLYFTAVLNVNHSWSFFSTPGGILYVSQQLSMPTILSQSVAKPNGTNSAFYIRSITHKMDSISLLLKDKTFDIFTVSKTCLNPRVTDVEITIPGYSVVRKD